MKAARGRPKKYDAHTALQAATELFWAQGFSGTSLDDLSTAMDMNRPSIYRAFGDKEAVYRQALAHFAHQMEHGFTQTVVAETDIRKGLSSFYAAALDVYCSGNSSMGCMVMCTAPAAALTHVDVQADLLKVVSQLDQRITQQIERAVEQGQLDEQINSEAISKLLQAVLHSLAIRARAGETKDTLLKFANESLSVILGAAVADEV